MLYHRWSWVQSSASASCSGVPPQNRLSRCTWPGLYLPAGGSWTASSQSCSARHWRKWPCCVYTPGKPWDARRKSLRVITRVVVQGLLIMQTSSLHTCDAREIEKQLIGYHKVLVFLHQQKQTTHHSEEWMSEDDVLAVCAEYPRMQRHRDFLT